MKINLDEVLAADRAAFLLGEGLAGLLHAIAFCQNDGSESHAHLAAKLAQKFRDECKRRGVRVTEPNGSLQEVRERISVILPILQEMNEGKL